MGLASSIHMPVDTEPLTGLHRGLTAMVGVAIEIDTIGVEMTGMEGGTGAIEIGAQDDTEVLQEPDHHPDTGGLPAEA